VTQHKAIILIVEDDVAFGYALKRHLEAHDYDVVAASSSVEALKEFEQQTVDVVITDIRLLKGEPHGLSLARMIRQKKPRIPVILMTAYPDLLQGESSLPGLVFHKPVELATLRNAVKTCLGTS
jgi:two-component system response regulator HydG